jgi:uncharacterized damage-inducible protein DinB
MFRRIGDFMEEWAVEREHTSRNMRLLSDESLSQAIVPGGRTLGFLAWHIAGTFREMLGHSGLQPDGPQVGEAVPSSAAVIADAYDRASASVLEQVRTHWQDDMLDDEIAMYGRSFRRGMVLEMLIRHEAHHRGQMTVLMRQAGLPVAGAYGPSREDWAGMGMEAHP